MVLERLGQPTPTSQSGFKRGLCFNEIIFINCQPNMGMQLMMPCNGTVSQIKRKEHGGSEEVENVKRQAVKGVNLSDHPQQAVEVCMVNSS